MRTINSEASGGVERAKRDAQRDMRDAGDGVFQAASRIVGEHAARTVAPKCWKCRARLVSAEERLTGLCARCEAETWDEDDDWYEDVIG